MKATKLGTLTALTVCFSLVCANALIAAPIYDTFGPLDQATFGGAGIPNEEVAVSTQIVDGDVTITIAMSATQRYSNPVVTNDGAGTYFAQTGSNFGGAGQSTTEGALWNFNYYIDVEGTNGATPVIADYQFDLYYDFDPALDNALATLGKIDVTAGVLASASPAATLLEDSQNLMFDFLAGVPPLPGLVFPPAGSFDPNALGEYNFAIQVSNSGGFNLETVAIDVQVENSTPIPEPSSAVLLIATLAGLISSRKNR